APSGGRIESYGVLFQQNEPTMGYVLARTPDGDRFAAKTEPGDSATLGVLLQDDPIGNQVSPQITATCNLFALH
ncbi:MAG: hypothetical protein HOC70_01245, partial [Gammaproteobacteria bacterium]|nr:hypothetical protein [Gammaproteobacteria bacterium]